MAALSWDMGCRLVGKLSSMVTTWEGSAARRAHSRESQFTCRGQEGLSCRAGGWQTPLTPWTDPPACYLLLGGHLSGNQQPEEPLGQRLLSPCSFGQQLLALRDAVAAEADALKSPAQASAAAASPSRGGCLSRAGSGPTSSGSSTEVSYIRPFMPLIPPYNWRRVERHGYWLQHSPAAPAWHSIPLLTMSTVICPMAVLPCCCLKLLTFACSLGIMLARTSFRFWEEGRGP